VGLRAATEPRADESFYRCKGFRDFNLFLSSELPAPGILTVGMWPWPLRRTYSAGDVPAGGS